MNISKLMKKKVKNLSGGELQRLGLVIALGKTAEVYFIDEPSAYLDCEWRLLSSKAIKDFIMESNKTAFIIEHDFIMATYLADRYLIFFDKKIELLCMKEVLVLAALLILQLDLLKG